MPELPDIEVFKRYLDATSLHQKIESVEARNEKVLGGVSARKLQSAAKGHEFASTRRHGKHLFAHLGDYGWLMLHFGMTGRLDYFENSDDEPRHSRVLFRFHNGYHLSFEDARMFGKVDLVESPDEFIESESLGPDALDADLSTFRERLAGRRGAIKAALMNQRILAGLGNIYSDEVLFQARIHPNTCANRLDEKAIKGLHRQTGKVLQKAIERGAYPNELPDSYLLPHRREGEKCPRCGGEVKKIKAAGRTAYYCPACQPER